MPVTAPEFSIILAGGKGTRMRSDKLHKVCFPINGVPAVNRAIGIYNSCGVRHHVVVVGTLAGQVVETIGSMFSNVSYVYQREALGTANAVKTAMDSLSFLDGREDILIVAGDRIIEASVLERFFDVFHAGQCDFALLAVPGDVESSQGRVVESADGSPVAVIEAADIRQRAALKAVRKKIVSGTVLSRSELRAIILKHFSPNDKNPSVEKLETAFGELWKELGRGRALHRKALETMVPVEMTGFSFRSGSGTVIKLTPEKAAKITLMNNSVYLVKAAALRYALSCLDRNNAQREEYLSGIAETFFKAENSFKTRVVRVDNPRLVMGFNDPAELLGVEEKLASLSSGKADIKPSPWFRKIPQWREIFRNASKNTGPLAKELRSLYGDYPGVVRERVKAYMELLKRAASVLPGDAGVFIVRSPGRANVMGRHIDHQGGNCNLMTIGYETIMAVAPRRDDLVRIHNLDNSRFSDREFSIGGLVADLPWDDWLSLVNSEKLCAMLRDKGGDWSGYVMAAALRLQKKFSGEKLRGMDMIVSGNVPMAAGLSSSSSLVVATAEALVAANGLLTFPTQIVDLCGEGEWFVGTRGGSADHAAVKLGQKGKIIKVKFFDFAVQESVAFPKDMVLALCDSGIKAQKTVNAKDQFNHRISCYRIGYKLITTMFPHYAPLLKHLRDVNTRNLGVPLSWIYKILLHLPENATRAETEEMLKGHDTARFFSAHKPPPDGNYPVRGVTLFGLAECERARLYSELLKAGDISGIGRMMNISHDGDRVAAHDKNLVSTPFNAPVSNSYILGLLEDLESGDPERVLRAQLQWQPGSYHCSVPEIDLMVDLAVRTPGVAGAQLAGAGLGGCMMVFAHRDSLGGLADNLTKFYYKPFKKEPAVHVCNPVAGAGVLLKDDV